ncbi:dual specificity protein phosphatase family protein [Murinocardiopsis flavida]|uniref:dual specificity protein phosphatase family protein n=1 Tax=Murinocardiopsis flavida TaxID=645275 RepID=UPI001FE4AC98|nr:dual specificity protein phosphatase family protein [Murinocardiopsis flavida]
MNATGRRSHIPDPREDRAAGALLGAAAALVIAGAPTRAAAGLLGAGTGADHGTAHPGHLVRAVLERIGDPGAVAGAVDGDAERSWALALRALVAGDTAPPVRAGEGSHPAQVALRAAAEAPVPPDDPARGSFPCGHLVGAVHRAHALDRAVRGGNGHGDPGGRGGWDAAMYAGALAGARWGASGIPLDAQRRLSEEAAPRAFIGSALTALRGSDPGTWPEQRSNDPGADPHLVVPFRVAHPDDPGVVLCNMPFARACADAEAVVSLCRQGTEDGPAHLRPADRSDVWLFDRQGANPNLAFVLDDAARMVAAMRAEGKRVLLHCAAGQSRTPAVAARYAVLARGAEVRTALRGAIRAVGGHLNTPELARTVASLSGVALADPVAELFPAGLPTMRHALDR